MKRKYKTIVVDDHPLMAQATLQLVSQMDRIETAGFAKSGEDAIQLAAAVSPDLVLLDYQLPDLSGTQVAERLKAAHPNLKIIIFTGVDVSDLLPFLLSNLISGIISKGVTESTMKHIVACVLDNHIVLPQSMMSQLKSMSGKDNVDQLLSEEEVLLMTLIIKGDTYEKIAERMYISKRSVDNYLRRIYEKLGVQTRAQAIERFVQSSQYQS
ncbi:response regulator transcription factor [Cohnella hashimotonis]|uniref:Response regulator transcription factor n=1 Tax=Cohnella hashimotonis TaxID=2826895 RepID=A0ABT6TFX5_9BACL|nr:response regulator transcription factor [Cohnella hashimotonis]MDI4645741.1 response regulator transcription factor [Cohnella hashimotonis]